MHHPLRPALRLLHSKNGSAEHYSKEQPLSWRPIILRMCICS